MPQLVANCPRCKAKSHTFDVFAMLQVNMKYGWQHHYEAFSVCLNCSKSTTFELAEDTGHDTDLFSKMDPMNLQQSLNNFFRVEGYLSAKNMIALEVPHHVPEEVSIVFREAAACVALQCWNAAGCMFRTCLDLATRPLLPVEDEAGLNSKTRRDLGLRLPWLLSNGKLPADLTELSVAVREDGNDGAHRGTLTQSDAEDLADFTSMLLDRIYTQPKRLELAKSRRDERRGR